MLIAAVAAWPAALAAQQSAQRQCVIAIDSVRSQGRFLPEEQQYFAGGGVFGHCLNDTTTIFRMDSIAWYHARGYAWFIGNVHFEDSTAALDADHVTYWIRQERLEARGNVYTRNRRTRSELRGPYLDYYRAVPGVRDTIEMFGNQRPRILVYGRRDSAAAVDTAGEPFVVIADRVRMRHTDRMWGAGRLTIDRSDLSARADSAFLNLADSVAFLLGSPEVTGRDTTAPADSNTYRLTGHRMRFDLDGRQEIRRIVSTGRARATGPEWLLRGDTLDIALDSGKVQRAQAWGLMDDEQPFAHSGLSTVHGDSLDIHMPGQVMRLVRAYGDTRARSRPDSTVLEEDWLTGDTLNATFAEVDSAGRRRSEIERVVAMGRARAYYHVENERDSLGPRGISYSRGDRIRIALRERRVRTVDVAGNADGVYLEPLRRTADTTGTDSARADTLRADTVRADSARADSAARVPRPGATPSRPDTTAPATPRPARPVSPRPRPATPPRPRGTR
jgi:hypothetical protein